MNLDNQIDEILTGLENSVQAYIIKMQNGGSPKSTKSTHLQAKQAIKSLVESERRKARKDELIRSNDWVGGNIGGNLCKRMYTQYYLTRLSALKEETNG